MIKKTLLASALALLTGAATASAQQIAFDISGFAGLYTPTNDLIEADAALFDVPGDVLTAEQESAIAFGGRITAWLRESFAIEGSFTYALSDGEIEIDDQEVSDDAFVTDANVWFGSVKALYRFVPGPASIWAIHFGAGPALISRGGDAFDDADGTTDIGGVLDVGATFNVAPTVAIRIDVEDYLYSAKLEDSGTGAEIGDSRFQNDLLLTGGLVIKLGR